MKLSATAAALFIWLQFALCVPAFAETFPHGDELGSEHPHAQPADVDSTGAHREEGAPHSHDQDTGSGEDHCDLVARTLVSDSPTVGPPSLLTFPASISLQAGEAPIVSLSVRRSLRASPRPPDLILQNASFLL